MRSAANDHSFGYMHLMSERFLERCQRGRACEDGAHRAQDNWMELFLPLYRPWTFKYTHLCVKKPIFANILINSNLGLLSESNQRRKLTFVTLIRRNIDLIYTKEYAVFLYIFITYILYVTFLIYLFRCSVFFCPIAYKQGQSWPNG